jgi:hypothetical protein
MWLKGFCENWRPFPVFTTNYDWTFERVVERLKQRITAGVDGFVMKPMGSIWDAQVFHRLKGARRWQFVLFKLHGSTSWYRQTSGRIVKIMHAEKDPGRLTNVVIYPTQAKTRLVDDEPFRTAYQYLRACLSIGARLCLVIGYSFRDPEINQAFKLGLANNPRLCMIVLDPKPDKERIWSALQCGPDKITFVEDEFRYYGIDRNAALRHAIEALMTAKSIMHQRVTARE